MADSCPSIIGDPAVGMTVQAYDKYSSFASQAYDLATKEAVQLAGFTLAPIAFQAAYDLGSNLTGFSRPTQPGTLVAAFDDVDKPALPPTVTLPGITFIDPPQDNTSPPVLTVPTAPQPLAATPPGPLDPLATIVLPDKPDPVMPTLGELQAITLPTLDPITLPTFTAVAPVVDFGAPLESFSFQVNPYSDTLLPAVEASIQSILATGNGLPPAVEQALRDRAFSDVDAQEVRAIQQATEEYASRGFSQPSGILSARLAEVRQNNQNQRNKLSRDIYINAQQVAIENVKFAIGQGVTLEATLQSNYYQLMSLSLESAKFGFQMAVEVFNAKVSLFNAQTQAFATAAQVYRDRIQAELAKVEIFKAKIDAQRLVSEINSQTIAIYNAQLNAVAQLIQIYVAEVSAQKLIAETNTEIVNAYRAKVEAFGAQVQAFVAEWDAYKAQVDAELAQEKIYETSVNAYATRVKAWSDQQSQKIEVGKLNIADKDLALRAWRSQLDLYLGEISAQRDILNAKVAVYQGNVETYKAEAGVETAAADANMRQFTALMQSERARVDTAIENAKVRINQLIQTTALAVEAEKAAAQTASQLAASAMSAVHFGASVSSSSSDSQSCNTNFNNNTSVSTSL